MWFSAIKLAVSAGSHIYKKRQETRMLMADAQRTHAQRMARGEIEYKQAITQSHQGWKDEFVLILVSAPIMLLIWSVFSNDPAILDKVNRFFELFGAMPTWYQILFISVVASIYGLKGADIMKRK